MSQEAKILSVVGVITLVIIVGAAIFLNGGQQQQNQQTTTISKADQKLLVKSDSHQTQKPNAKVVLVEFGDYECPACGSAYPIVNEILSTYKNKIDFVFRNFPLTTVHQNAMIAAEAAEAAGAQGKYWEMHNKLYENQQEWGESTNPMDFFTNYAKELHLNVDQLVNDVQNKKYEKQIMADENDGNALGINATPTFFLNNQELVGVPTYNDLKNKIDALLKK